VAAGRGGGDWFDSGAHVCILVPYLGSRAGGRALFYDAIGKTDYVC
jgi:hypothetical protein